VLLYACQIKLKVGRGFGAHLHQPHVVWHRWQDTLQIEAALRPPSGTHIRVSHPRMRSADTGERGRFYLASRPGVTHRLPTAPPLLWKTCGQRGSVWSCRSAQQGIHAGISVVPDLFATECFIVLTTHL